ncbi:MAG: hypothetical protein ACYDCK_02575 [Thermoplasmatota archaeon]
MRIATLGLATILIVAFCVFPSVNEGSVDASSPSAHGIPSLLMLADDSAAVRVAPASGGSRERNHKWVREESARALEELVLSVQQREFVAKRRVLATSWGTVDYLLHALLGLAPWPSESRDMERLEFVLDALMERSPRVAMLLRAEVAYRTATPTESEAGFA